MPGYLNDRLAKVHRTYTVDEIASRWGVHKNTVRNWLKQGLTPIDERRPILIHGRDLAAYLKAKRQRRKSSCAPGELYCVRCHAPRRPAGDIMRYRELSPAHGNLEAVCSECGVSMFRRVSEAQIEQVRGTVAVARQHPPEHLVDSD